MRYIKLFEGWLRTRTQVPLKMDLDDNAKIETLDIIKDNCVPFLNELKNFYENYNPPINKNQRIDFLFYRWVGYKKWKEHEGDIIIKKPTRKNRKPLDTAISIHNLLDEIFQSIHGLKARSQGVFAAPGGYKFSYKDFLFFPIGNYKYLYNENVKDIFDYLDPQFSSFHKVSEFLNENKIPSPERPFRADNKYLNVMDVKIAIYGYKLRSQNFIDKEEENKFSIIDFIKHSKLNNFLNYGFNLGKPQYEIIALLRGLYKTPNDRLTIKHKEDIRKINNLLDWCEEVTKIYFEKLISGYKKSGIFKATLSNDPFEAVFMCENYYLVETSIIQNMKDIEYLLNIN